MKKFDTVLFVVAARSGSKGVPNKNIADIGGIPLLAYPIKRALALTTPDRVWISTDSQEYADIARAHGATVPFLRPAELANDGAKSTDVLFHAWEESKRLGMKVETIVLLEPTSPFIRAKTLQKALEDLQSDGNAKSSVASRYSHPHSFFIQPETRFLDAVSERIRGAKGGIRRQDFENEITPSGGFYAVKVHAFAEAKTYYTNRTLAPLVDDIEGIEIDRAIDLDFSRYLVEKEIIDTRELFGV